MDKDYLHLSDLLLQLADNSITPEQMEDLDNLLKTKTNAVEFGSELLLILHLIRSECKQLLVSDNPPIELSDSFDIDLWVSMARQEMEAPGFKCRHEVSPAKKTVPQKGTERNTMRKTDKVSLFTALVSLAAMLMILLYPHVAPTPLSPCVGQITGAVNAQWADPSGMLREGSDLYPGVMELTRGLAEVTLDSGAKVILEAPLEVELESDRQIYLKKGRLVADVAGQAEKQFVVRTPNAAIVDFGTEFGVSFTEGKTQTLVFKGEVEIRNSANLLRYEKRLVLKKDQGGQVDSSGILSSKQLPPAAFVRAEEFGVHVKASKGSAYHRWLAYSYALRRDPSLVAYYTFERDPADPQRVRNLAGTTGARLDGYLANIPEPQRPLWTNGRWPGKSALQFGRTRQHYLVVSSDEAVNLNGPVTLVAWIKCPERTGGGHIISNRMLNGGVCNYQLGYRTSSLPDTQDSLHIARKKRTDDWSNHVFSSPLQPSSNWMMIAVTHDNQMVSFYCDGQLLDSRPWRHQQDAVAADLWIGTDGTSNDAFYFNGIIDEIAIFKRALEPAEIQRMYEMGKS